MKQGTGMAVFPGVAIGKPFVYRKTLSQQPQTQGTPTQELKKFRKALTAARQQLSQLYRQAIDDLGEDQAAIVEVQMLMLEDLDYLEGVEGGIADGLSAAEAVFECGETFAEMFASLDDEYMKARSADIRDVSRRIYDILCGNQQFSLPEGKFILVAKDLAPSQTIQLPRDRILAFVTQEGSASSHTAILARTLNIPSLVQANISLDDVETCGQMAIDGFTGTWYLDPEETTLTRLEEARQRWQEDLQGMEPYRGRESVTKTGKKILLCANIGCPEDVAPTLEGDAEGVGLMRSEFLYLGRENLPSEEELFQAYRQVAEAMGDRPVVIRTLDIGADKQVSYLNLDKEENPVLGLRGLRLCLHREDLFRPQLRAIYRASGYGNLSIMFPMVASVWELQQAKALCADVRRELTEAGIPCKEIPIGVMIETPAAAILAGELAKEADFFSVGTNDLTQYTLAVDRQNAKLGDFYDPHHPALLALLTYIAKCAEENGIWAGICGELGADETMTENFLRMGYRELSMAPGKILEIRKIVCESEE